MTLKEFIPREHGAWAMWIVPMLSAALVAGFSARFLALFFSFAALYVVHHPVLLMIRRRRIPDMKEGGPVAALALPALAVGFALVFPGGRLWLLVFGAAEAVFFIFSIKSFLDREQRSFSNEIEIVAALTLTAPAAYYAITGRLDLTAAALFALNFLFFTSSVFYVKMRIEFLKKKGAWKGGARKALVMTIFYHLFLLALVIAAAEDGVVSPWIILGFVPSLAQVAAGVFAREARMNFTRLGIALVVQSAVFLAVTGIFLR